MSLKYHPRKQLSYIISDIQISLLNLKIFKRSFKSYTFILAFSCIIVNCIIVRYWLFLKDKNETIYSKGFRFLTAASIFVVHIVLYIPFLRGILGDEGYGIYGVVSSIHIYICNSKLRYSCGNIKIHIRAYLYGTTKMHIELLASTFLSYCYWGCIGNRYVCLCRTYIKGFAFEKSYLAILALSPTIFITAVASAYRGYFQGRGNMTYTATSQVLEQITNVIFTLLFAVLLMRYGVEAACAGGTVGTSLGALAAMIFMIFIFYKNRKSIIPKNKVKTDVKRYPYKELAKKIIHYSIPITISVGATYAGNLVDMAIQKIRLMAGGYAEDTATILYGFLTKYQQLMNVLYPLWQLLLLLFCLPLRFYGVK